MRKHTTILIDQDGVLANYSKRLIELTCEKYPNESKVAEGEMRYFDTEKHFSPHLWKEIDKLALQRGFFEDLEPIPGSREALHQLLALGYDVRICTAPKRHFENCIPEKMLWIKKHLGQEFAERTILTRDKTLVRGAILIDDKPEVVGNMKPEWEHILFDQPYNREVAGKRRIDWGNYREVLGV